MFRNIYLCLRILWQIGMSNFDETRHSEVSQWDLSTNRVLEQLNLLFLRYVNSKNDKNWSLQNFDFAPSRVTGIGTEKSYWANFRCCIVRVVLRCGEFQQNRMCKSFTINLNTRKYLAKSQIIYFWHCNSFSTCLILLKFGLWVELFVLLRCGEFQQHRMCKFFTINLNTRTYLLDTFLPDFCHIWL